MKHERPGPRIDPPIRGWLRGRVLSRRQFLGAVALGAAATIVGPRGGRRVEGALSPPDVLEGALRHIAEEMDRFHRAFDVYTDLGAPGNHFVMLGKIESTPGSVEIDPGSSDSPRSGATAIKNVFHNRAGMNWGGWYFLNGVLSGDDRQPAANWGEAPNAGIDLRGAARLTFWARGAKGGEQIEFFMGGVGRDETGVPTQPFPDSTPRIPIKGVTTTLTPSWQPYAIDVTAADLRYVVGGFGWVATGARNPGGAIFWLDDIAYDKPRLEEPRFVRSYVTAPSNRPFDTVQRNVAFTYDNAIAMLAFMARGTDDDWRRARLIADAVLYAQEHDRFYDDGRLRNAYQAGDLWLPPGWTPNGRAQTVRMPGFWNGTNMDWVEDRFQVSCHTGNVAWAMIGLLAFYKAAGGAQYLNAAQAMGRWVFGRSEKAGFGGYRGGFEGWEKPSPDFSGDPAEVAWGSTEHNLDLCAAFGRLFELTGDQSWDAAAAHARAFVERMWDPTRGCFLTGTKDAGTLNRDVLPLDVQPWSILALPDGLERFNAALLCAEAHHQTQADGFLGFDFDADRDGVWFEGTAHMAAAYTIAGERAKATQFLDQLRHAQMSAANANGAGLVAASHDGVTTGFTQPDGNALLLFARLHVGASGWHALAQLNVNPYYLFQVAIAVGMNQGEFSPGHTAIFSLNVRNRGPALAGDFYIGAVLPDRETAVFLTKVAPAEFLLCRLDTPSSFPPLAREVTVHPLLELEAVIASYPFTGTEPAGDYIFFAALTRAHALDADEIQPGAILAFHSAPFRFTQ